MKKPRNIYVTEEVFEDYRAICNDLGSTPSVELERYMRRKISDRDRKTTNLDGDNNE